MFYNLFSLIQSCTRRSFKHNELLLTQEIVHKIWQLHCNFYGTLFTNWFLTIPFSIDGAYKMSNLLFDMSMYVYNRRHWYFACLLTHTVHYSRSPQDYFRSFMMKYGLLYGSSVTFNLFIAVVCSSCVLTAVGSEFWQLSISVVTNYDSSWRGYWKFLILCNDWI
jgi:hypothetical protein